MEKIAPKFTDKLELMRTYYLGSEEAESFPSFLSALVTLRENLLSDSLIDKSFNFNSLCRVVCRCSRVISELFQNTHSDIGIRLKKIEDIYFWHNEYLPYTPHEYPLVLEIDWIKLFKEIFRIKKENADKKIEDIIPEFVCEIEVCTSSIFGDRKISVSEFLAFIKAIPGEKVGKRHTRNSLLDLVMSGHGELFSRASQFFSDGDYRKSIKGLNDLKNKRCKGAPICFEGLLTTLSKSRTRTGLEKGEKLQRDLGFDKVWYRRRKALLAYSDYMSSTILISRWGLKSFIGILSSDVSNESQKNSDRLSSFVVREFEEAISITTSCLKNLKDMVNLCEDKKFYDHYIRTLNLYKYQLLIMGFDSDFCRSYFTNSYNVEAPSDWFDEVTT